MKYKEDFSGRDFSNQDLTRRDFSFCNLRGANFQGANLESAWFFDSNLNLAKLQGANLQHAKLQDANLEGANLEGANLQGALLRGANLDWANLKEANLQHANLAKACLVEVRLQGADLRGANLQGTHLRGSHLESADLRGANLQDAVLFETIFFDANLENANLEGANLTLARFRGANLKFAKLQDAVIEDANFEGAKMEKKMKKNIFMFDVESTTLHGSAFAVGAVVVDPEGQEIDRFELLSKEGMDLCGDWVKKNVIPHLGSMPTCEKDKELRDKFFEFYVKHKDNAQIWSDVNFPVETNFLSAIVADSPEDRQWAMPYPLMDASWLVNIDIDRVEACGIEGLRKHNPLDDSRASVALLLKHLYV